MKPIVQKHNNIYVVRDDLYPGGTKARFFPLLFEYANEVVYASPAEGGAQTALAYTGKILGKKVTIFVAKRKTPHPRSLEAKRHGAKIIQVKCGYLNVVQSKAKMYCQEYGAKLLPFGADCKEAIDKIATDAKLINVEPDEVWCAAGSGVLARALGKAFPNAKINAVEVGRELTSQDVNGAKIYKTNLSFSKPSKKLPPFPSDPHYDAKAWEVCNNNCGSGVVLFWNVTGPAKP